MLWFAGAEAYAGGRETGSGEPYPVKMLRRVMNEIPKAEKLN